MIGQLGSTWGRGVRRLALLVALSLVLAACSGSSGGTTTTAASGGDDAPATTAAETPTETTAGGGGEDDGGDSGASDTLRAALPTIGSNIDPSVYEGYPSTEVEAIWSATLYEFVDPPGIGADQRGLTGIEFTEPLLVESEEEEEDGSLVITLRDDAVSAYGNTITAEDVKWTFERAVATDFVGRFVMSVGAIDPENPIEVIDERTFRLNVMEPNPYVRGILTLWDLSPLDSAEATQHATEDDPWASEWLATNSATFGPYHVSSFTPGEQIVLEPNPGWFGEPPDFPNVVIQQVPEASNRLQLLTQGEVDYVYGLLPDQLEAVEAAEASEVVTRLTPRVVALELNHAFEAFQDPRVRQAISMAIDREALVNGPMRGLAKVMANQIPSALPQPEGGVEPVEYNPDEARRLLEEAGYGDGLSFPFTINLTRPGPYAEQLAVLLQSQLAEVGVNLEIEVIASNAEFEEKKTSGQLTAWLGANTPFLQDTWYFMQLEHHSTDAFQNWKAYASEDFDRMISELRNLPIGEDRDAKVLEIHQYLMENPPWIPVFEEVNFLGISSNIDPDSVRKYVSYAPFVREFEKR